MDDSIIITVTMASYPNTKQLGSIIDVIAYILGYI